MKGTPTWDQLCSDTKVDEFNTLPNQNVKKILKEVITKLWYPGIKKSMLPPTVDSPAHIKEIWKRVSTIYFSKICKIT